MAADTRESIEMVKCMDRAYSISQMAADTRESLKMTKCMERAYYIY